MARAFSALHGTTIACAVLFCFHIFFIIRRQNHGKAKSGSSPSRRTSYGTLVGSPADCTRPCPARHPPVVIVSNDLSNTYSPVVSVVPCTTQRRKPTLPTHVYLRGYGLSSGSIAMCEQVMPLDRCIRLSTGRFVSCPNETPCQNDRRFFSAASGAARDSRTTFLHASRVNPPASSASKGRRAW